VTTFSVSTASTATVDADRQRVWAALTDPDLVVRLTPYLSRIDADHDHGRHRWTWHLVRIPLLGSMVSPSFTEVMTFDEPSRIDFVHDPERTDEKAGVDGRYVLKEAGRSTDLSIELTITVELPFPKVARPAVHTAMRAVIATMGIRFSHNLVRHLSAEDA
jgi:carbon monoxide dehydrogenase subunit G